MTLRRGAILWESIARRKFKIQPSTSQTPVFKSECNAFNFYLRIFPIQKKMQPNRSTSSKCFQRGQLPATRVGSILSFEKWACICLVHKPKSVLHVANTMALYVMTVIYCARRDNISLVNNTFEKMDHSLFPSCWPWCKADTVRAFRAKQLKLE